MHKAAAYFSKISLKFFGKTTKNADFVGRLSNILYTKGVLLTLHIYLRT